MADLNAVAPGLANPHRRIARSEPEIPPGKLEHHAGWGAAAIVGVQIQVAAGPVDAVVAPEAHFSTFGLDAADRQSSRMADYLVELAQAARPAPGVRVGVVDRELRGRGRRRDGQQSDHDQTGHCGHSGLQVGVCRHLRSRLPDGWFEPCTCA